jgi:putative FmdB family regulatory protein
MPTYEYECRSCKHRFDLRQSFQDEPQAACPKCKGESRRVFHPAPIIFKGSGFYVTDHSKPNPASAKSEPKKEPEAKKETKTETKKESKPSAEKKA